VGNMKVSPLQLIGRILLIVGFVWMLVDSTQIALDYETEKANSVVKNAHAIEANAQYID